MKLLVALTLIATAAVLHLYLRTRDILAGPVGEDDFEHPRSTPWGEMVAPISAQSACAESRDTSAGGSGRDNPVHSLNSVLSENTHRP